MGQLNSSTVLTTRSNSTKRINCTCQHEYQDSKYGKGIRIANFAPKKNGFVCSVCSRVHSK